MKIMKMRNNFLTVLFVLAVVSILVFTQVALASASTGVIRTKGLGVTYWNPEKACSGYTLFGGLSGKDLWLIDMQGSIVNHWELPSNPGCYGKLLPNSNLLYACASDPAEKRAVGVPFTSGQGGLIREVDWDNNLVWEYYDPFMHHDFCRMENGNTMVLKYVEVPFDIMVSIKGGVPGTEQGGKMWTAEFDEVTPEGKVIWSWKSYEHMNPEEFPICPLCWRAEWTHANTCVVLPDGDILTSFRNLNVICIIDKKTGDIIWKWGDKAGQLAHQHDPHFLPNGNILIFDNGIHRALGEINYSRVVELNPKTKEVVWTYTAPVMCDFFSSACSGAQRLPNGNTLICETMKGRIFEVTPGGEIVWEYKSPFFNPYLAWGTLNWVFRAYRYGPDYPGLEGKALDPADFANWNLLYGPEAFK